MRCRLVIRELDVLHLLRKQLHAQVLVRDNVVQAIVGLLLWQDLLKQVWFRSWFPCWAPLVFYPMVDHRVKHEGSPKRKTKNRTKLVSESDRLRAEVVLMHAGLRGQVIALRGASC